MFTHCYIKYVNNNTDKPIFIKFPFHKTCNILLPICTLYFLPYTYYMLFIILLTNPNICSSSKLFVLCTLLHYPWSCCTLFSLCTFRFLPFVYFWNMLILPHIPSERHSVTYVAFDVIALLVVSLSTSSCKYYIR